MKKYRLFICALLITVLALTGCSSIYTASKTAKAISGTEKSEENDESGDDRENDAGTKRQRPERDQDDQERKGQDEPEQDEQGRQDEKGGFEGILSWLESENAIYVYFTDTCTDEQKEQIGDKIKEIDGVENAKYINSDEVFEMLDDFMWSDEDNSRDKGMVIFPIEFDDFYIISLDQDADSSEIMDKIMDIDGVSDASTEISMPNLPSFNKKEEPGADDSL